jgi:hypothetical protein
MKCLNREEMQIYIDHEFSLLKQNEIHQHIENCKTCLTLYDEAIIEKKLLINVLSYYNEETSSNNIPEFILPKRKQRKYNLKILKIAASIALIIGLFFVFQKKKEPENKQKNIPIFSIESLDNTDPNKKWHNNQMEIVITDENGNIVESFISEK